MSVSILLKCGVHHIPSLSRLLFFWFYFSCIIIVVITNKIFSIVQLINYQQITDIIVETKHSLTVLLNIYLTLPRKLLEQALFIKSEEK